VVVLVQGPNVPALRDVNAPNLCSVVQDRTVFLTPVEKKMIRKPAGGGRLCRAHDPDMAHIDDAIVGLL
jgi:hypothetical protein